MHANPKEPKRKQNEKKAQQTKTNQQHCSICQKQLAMSRREGARVTVADSLAHWLLKKSTLTRSTAVIGGNTHTAAHPYKGNKKTGWILMFMAARRYFSL